MQEYNLGKVDWTLITEGAELFKEFVHSTAINKVKYLLEIDYHHVIDSLNDDELRFVCVETEYNEPDRACVINSFGWYHAENIVRLMQTDPCLTALDDAIFCMSHASSLNSQRT